MIQSMNTAISTEEKMESSENGSKQQISAVSDGQSDLLISQNSRKSESDIREAAYLLWEAAGRPETDGVSFWLEAENL